MKNSKRMCRQGWSILSAFFTKVIVLSLCLSLALGTTAFAGDDAVAASPAAASSETGGSGDSGSTDSNPADTGDSNDTGSPSDNADGSDSNTTEGDGPSDSEDKGDTPSNDVTGTEQGSDSEEDEPADTDTSATEAPKADEQPVDTTNEPETEETDKTADSETDELADSEQEENKQEQPAEEPAEETKPEAEQEQEELPPVEVTEGQQEAVTDAIAMFAEQGTQQTERKDVDTFDKLQETLKMKKPEGLAENEKYPVVIKITDDIAISNTLNIPDWMEVTLVLNGKTLSYNGAGTAMFEVAGGLSVFDELEGVSDERSESSSEGTTEGGSVDTTEDASENTTGGSQSSTSSSNSSSSSNSGNSSNSSSSNSSSKSEHKNSSNVVTAKDEQTSENKPVEKPKTDNNTAEQKDALQETLKNWVNEDGSVKETKEVVDKVLKEVGTITTEKAVNVIFNVVAGGQLNLFGGIIKNGVGVNSSVTGVKVEKDGAFEMSGGVIADMTNSGVIINGGKAEIGGGAAIVNNSTKLNGGGISVKNGGTLTMDGGLIAGNEAIFDGKSEHHNGFVSWAKDPNGEYLYKDVYGGASGNGGGVAVDESTFTMTGGKIHGNNADTGKGQYDRYGVNGLDGLGGGVYVVGENGSFNLSGKGVISNNEAGAGGGIFIHTRNKNGHANADGALFTMTGGEVSGNTALHGEGGGIFINSRFGNANKNNKITAGKITGNKTQTTKDLGGGGIYVNNEGTLNIQNAIVTANLAQGLGGGFAACVHGRTIVFTKNGAIFFDNKGLGNAFTEGHENEWNDFKGNGDKIDGNSLWKDNEEFKELAQDIFAASDMGTDGNMGGILIGNETLFNGDASWEGYRFYYDENGKIVSDKVEYDEEGKVIYANRLLGLTSNPDDAAVLKALEVMNNALSGYLIISGNESSLHGGGIANNGVLTIGVEQKEFDETPDEVSDEFDMDKTLEKDEEAPEDTPDRELQDGEFEFVLKDENGKELDSVKNDADGKVNIKLPDFKEPGKYTFLVSEKDSGNAPNSETTVIYDGNVYVVVIEVTENITEEVVNVGGVEYIIKHSELTAGEMKFYKAELDENGNVKYDEEGKPMYNTEEELPGIAFNNKYTKPEEPEKPEEKPEEPETPDTPNRPNTPDVTVPDSPTPLSDVPEVEIPDEGVPLSEVSEEMEINDPEVPLGDVPRTGDAPVFPFAAAILGICGMLLAKLRKIS